MTERQTPRAARQRAACLWGAVLALGVILGATLGGSLGAGCSKRGSGGAEPRPPVDRPLMACLGALRALHRQADLHLARGDAPAALRAVEQILALKCVEGKHPEVQEAVLDAYGRLGRLHLKLGQLDQAAERVAQGLRRPGPPSFFRANLHMVEGDLLDARAEAEDGAGRKESADGLRRKAIEAFDRSAKMNMDLLGELVK